MKIGVHGDSFTMAKQEYQHESSWFEFLAENHNHNVTTFGINGASLFYSMQLFLKNHHLFDRNIFAITNPHRFVIPDHIPNYPQHLKYVCGLYSTEVFQLDAKQLFYSAEVLHTLKSAENYILHLQDDEYELHIHQLMVEQITRIRPDTILMPCFSSSIQDTKSLPLLIINEIENTTLGKNWNKDWEVLIRNKIDTRRCHMNEENNLMISKKIVGCIETGESFHLDQHDILLPKESIIKYFIPRYEPIITT